MSDQGNRWAEMTMPWQAGTGPGMNIALMTSAVLARALWSFPFPGRASEVELRTVLGEVLRRVDPTDHGPASGSLVLEDQSLVLRKCLHEKGLIESDTAHYPVGKGLLLNSGLGSALVVNEEDHLRIKAWRAGFHPQETASDALALERRLDHQLEFAFSEALGYLTARPTRVGTGLRMVSLLHLPGLVMAGEIEKVVNALRQLQFAVQGLGGGASPVTGCLFLVSNLITLGRSEEEVAEDFAVHVGKIVLYERTARRQLYEADPLGVEDLALRAWAVCRGARLMTLQEGFDRLSNLRLGASLGILPEFDPEIPGRLMISQQAGHLELAAGKPLQGKELMAARAELFRRSLPSAGA